MTILGKIAELYPENLIFWSSEKLCIKPEEERRFTENALANIFAELLVRAYFNPQSEIIADCLSKKLPEESLKQYNAWRLIVSPNNTPPDLDIISQTDKNKSNRKFLDKVQSVARYRFRNLLGRCDGIVPVAIKEIDGKGRGYAVPFRLEETEDSAVCAIDLDGKPVPEWFDAVSGLRLPGVCVRFLFHASVDSGLKFEGFSLQFPVLMAYWRQTGLLPAYNPFAVFATGRIQDGRLLSVDCCREKFDGLIERFGKQIVFFYPDNEEADERQQAPIPAETPEHVVLSKCQGQLESRKNDIGLRSFGIRYYNNRLQSILISVKKDTESYWDGAIEFLESFLNELDKDRHPELYLNSLLVLSFAYCHSAHTSIAHDYNLKAVEFANSAADIFDIDLRYELLLLSIEEMVLLQDEENFEQIPILASEIKGQLDKLGENSIVPYDDLRMRYYGTLGQAHMCGAVCQMEGFDKDIALFYIRKAVYYANKYQDNTVEDNIDEVIRDMNYRHLWYALFDPDSEEEKANYESALQVTMNQQQPGKLQDVNRHFQFRQKCFAAYRRILLSSPNENASYADESIPALASIWDWLKGLIYKYQAAGFAFLRRNSDAQDMFDESITFLAKQGVPLFLYMAMTVAAEVYRSFSVLGDAETAKQYQSAALALFSANDDFKNYKTASSWKRFLEMSWDEFQASGEDFPGLHYYY
ncbi:MAG: hypothetical protein IJQ39_14445 [Thermoguttaceae bacterium]|nr:hypothetical protein [Thermoguttaceae bacterium]